MRLLNISEKIGDIFDAPPGSMLIHSCNCKGSWGAGISSAFKDIYPYAYNIYKQYCKELAYIKMEHTLSGDVLIIPPYPGFEKQHYIACIFASNNYGKFKDSKYTININTKISMQLLCYHLKTIKQYNYIPEIRM